MAGEGVAPWAIGAPSNVASGFGLLRKNDGAWRAGYHGQSPPHCLIFCVDLVSSSLLPGLR